MIFAFVYPSVWLMQFYLLYPSTYSFSSWAALSCVSVRLIAENFLLRSEARSWNISCPLGTVVCSLLGGFY